MNVLVLPSWYPTATDKINGSFFHEQAKIISGEADVKVLICEFSSKPLTFSPFSAPIETLLAVLRVIFQVQVRVPNPDGEVFLTPPLAKFHQSTLNPVKKWRYRQRLRAYLKAYKKLTESGWTPDIVHAHSVKLGGIVAREIQRAFAVPYVITEHVPFALSNYPKFMRRDVRGAFENADLVLSLGYDKVRQLGMSGIDVEPNLVYNLVDENVCNKLCDKYEPGKPLKLISIGAASPLKDHLTLLRALHELKLRNVPFQMTLLGLKVWGGMYEKTLADIRDLDLEQEIDVVDHVPREEIPERLRSHQIFVLTSIAEGLPVSLLESQATGLFAVTTRHGGTEDVVTPSSSALAEVKNFRKIADHLQDVYSGKVTIEPNEIREHIVSLCGSEAFRNRLLGFYSKAIENAKQNKVA
jgi:glycosyltransferase involved in cell wall biosynthesis